MNEFLKVEKIFKKTRQNNFKIFTIANNKRVLKGRNIVKPRQKR